MRSFLTAIRFLTVLPAGRAEIDRKDLPLAIELFPVVGLFIGSILILAALTLSALGFNETALNAGVVVILIVITGGLHLDGLADTFDALGSGKPREEMLKIMRDPHIGTMGALALLSALFLKFSLLSCVPASGKFAAIILMCTLSRWSVVMALSWLSYTRSEGKAKIFTESARPKMTVLAALITLAIVSVTAHFQGVAVFALVTCAAYLFMMYVAKKIGGITGDTLGALSESMEVAALFFICILKGKIL
ncbi:MAG: adenosylcobinamide-GDP ribazoletransferase [Candidatus Omnitrophota bacterium]